jgi:hypothetical protein
LVSRFSSILSRKPVVESHFWLVADEERQVLGHEARLDRVDADLLQRLREALQVGIAVELGAMSRPRVQAKIEAIEFVEVSSPFWCSR